jgi:hypothetical protein
MAERITFLILKLVIPWDFTNGIKVVKLMGRK